MIKCWVRAESKDMAEPAAETQRVARVFVGIDRGAPNGDQPAYTEMEQQPDGSMLVTKCLTGDEARKAIEQREARPAVDVEGLAKVLDYVLEMRSHLCDDPRRTYVARDLAETAVKFMGKNGGIP